MAEGKPRCVVDAAFFFTQEAQPTPLLMRRIFRFRAFFAFRVPHSFRAGAALQCGALVVGRLLGY